MTELSPRTVQLQRCLERLQAGDDTARAELVGCACEQLTRLTRSLLRDYPRVKRWEQTDDVFQNAMMRLLNSLRKVKPVSTPQSMGLAALPHTHES